MHRELFNGNQLRKQTEGKKILVVGDIMLDKYISGTVTRISPEAPIPIIRVEQEKYALGGAANVAGNICGYYIQTYLCGMVGIDGNGSILKQILSDRNICFAGVESTLRCTTTKTRVIGMNQQLVRIDQEKTEEITIQEEIELLGKIRTLINDVQVIVLSDYNKGVCTETICREVIDMGILAGKKIIVDPKNCDWTKYSLATMITPNFKEFIEAIGYTVKNEEQEIADAADTLFNKYKIEKLLVTRSHYGMTLLGAGKPVTYEAVQQEVFDVSGAGDTVVATIAAVVAFGFSFEDAVEFSNYAAGLSVSKAGTYTVTVDEVLQYIRKNGITYEDKIVDKKDMEMILKNWRGENKKIVFTNGCFDILHTGHISYLNEARKLGDKLIIGVNTDRSVKQLKGAARPINVQLDRAKLLSALQCVDMVVFFDEETPYELIKIIHPDVLVKGGDYKPEEVVGREFADKLYLIPYLKGYSTTGIIDKLKK